MKRYKSRFCGQNEEEFLLNLENPSIDKPKNTISFCPPVQTDCTAVQLNFVSFAYLTIALLTVKQC